MPKRGKYSTPDTDWCEICDGHHGPGQHPEPAPEPASRFQGEPPFDQYPRPLAEFECDCGRRFTIARANELLASQGLTIVPIREAERESTG